MGETAERVGWGEVLGEGRLPLFVLICLAVWLNAADSLITATIMPTVGRALGGYAYFGWATAGYLTGSVLAGASSGWLATRFGLRAATSVAALLYAAGCAMSAVAPEIATFLVGRLLQGVGGGLLAGLGSVAIGLLFPNRTLPKVYSAISSVWGVAVVMGPLLGGLFIAAGSWRALFWAFAAQSLGVAVAAWTMLPDADGGGSARGVAWPQLSAIAFGIGLIAVAGLTQDVALAGLATGAGLGALLLALRLDSRREARLFPHGSGDPRTVHGAGYATLFLFYVATMGLTVYGPAVLQTLRGLSPLAAGYVVSAESLCWTVSALGVAGLTGAWPHRLTWLGALLILAGTAACAVVFDAGNLVLVVLAAGLIGVGFGISFAFISQAVLGTLPEHERGVGGGGIATARLTGAATGAALAAVVANLAGFAEGMSIPAARATGVWVFVAGLPVAALAILTARRVGAQR